MNDMTRRKFHEIPFGTVSKCTNLTHPVCHISLRHYVKLKSDFPIIRIEIVSVLLDVIGGYSDGFLFEMKNGWLDGRWRRHCRPKVEL